MDRIKNGCIRGTARVKTPGDKLGEARLRWFGPVKRRDSEFISRRRLETQLPGRRKGGRPLRGF